jgi:hypothetical protein
MPWRRARPVLAALLCVGALRTLPAGADEPIDFALIEALDREGDDVEELSRRVRADPESSARVAVEHLRRATEERVTYDALMLVPDAATRALLPVLDDPFPARRTRALEALQLLAHWWSVADVAGTVVDRIAAGWAQANVGERLLRLQVIHQAESHRVRARALLADAIRTGSTEVLAEATEIAIALREEGAPLLAVLAERMARDGGGPVAGNGRLGEGTLALLRALKELGPPDAEGMVLLGAVLGTGDVFHRNALLPVLGGWGGSSTPLLPQIRRLRADPASRWSAALALAAIPGGVAEGVRAVLAEGDSNPWGPSRAGHELDLLGARFSEALPVLLAAADGPSGKEREAALRVLGSAPPELVEVVLPVLRRALASPATAAREAEAAAWASYRDRPLPGEDDVVELALRHRHSEARRVAVMVLGRWHKGTKDLIQARRIAALLRDPDADVVAWAGHSLEEIGVVPPASLEDVRWALRSTREEAQRGGLAAARTMGEGAGPLLPELLSVASRSPRYAFDAVAATGVMDERVRAAIEAAVRDDPLSSVFVWQAFGRRAPFVEPAARAVVLEQKGWELRSVAKATFDPAEFALWLQAHSAQLGSYSVAWAATHLGVDGLPLLVSGAREHGRGLLAQARKTVQELGPASSAALLRIAAGREDGDAALALELVASVDPVGSVRAFLDAVRRGGEPMRAAAVRGLAAAYRLGVDPTPHLPALVACLDDAPSVLAGALEALAAGRRAPPGTVKLARGLLRHSDARVRIAAAEAVFALAGDAPAALTVLRDVLNTPTPSWAWIGRGGKPARTRDEYSSREQIWVATAETLGRMGAAAAPAARDLAWAALRHGEPRMQRLLTEPIGRMGRGAIDAGPLLQRLARTRSTWLAYHETRKELDQALATVLTGLGLEVPPPPAGWP